jgi:hypothetical protein
MKSSIQAAIATFGASAKQKLTNIAATGEPEDQLRAPFEGLLANMAELVNIPRAKVAAVGESSLRDLKTRPDYAVTVHSALVGFVELKSPGKGADPRKFRDPHDKAQWEKLRSLPNVLYTDGNAFSLWQNGDLVDGIVTLIGDVESSGDKLEAPAGLRTLFEKFLTWEPIPPRSAKELAQISARLCRFLRDEVTSPPWRRTGGSCSFLTPPTSASLMAMHKPSPSACSWHGRRKLNSPKDCTKSPPNWRNRIPSSAQRCVCSPTMLRTKPR